MAEIARAISEGADAFLKSEYKLLLIFIAIVFAGIWLGLGSITTPAHSLWARCSACWPVISA